MSVIDTGRFMALVTIAQADAVQAVYEAKWHYLFWRPVTAIRNGDIDGNDATERDATWEALGTCPAQGDRNSPRRWLLSRRHD
jgi:hypothetical protein